VARITAQIMSVTNSLFVNCSDGFTTHPGTFNLTSVGNTFENCNTAMRIRSRRNIIAANNIRAIRAGVSLSAFYEDTLISANNISEASSLNTLQWLGIAFTTLSSEIMNNNDFKNVVVQNNIIRRYGSNTASDGISFTRGTASNVNFTLDTNAEKRKASNIVVCDNRLYNCSIRVNAFTNRVCILRNAFDGQSNRTHFIQCQPNSARHKIAENFFNSTLTDAVSVGTTTNAAFSGETTTHRVGAALSELPTTSSLTNTDFLYRFTSRTELHDDILFSNGTGPIARRASGDATLEVDALPEDGTSNSRIRMFNESGTSTTGSKTLEVKGNASITGSLSKGSGSFKIDHPLKPETHYLVHSFIEGPQADNIYRGSVTLIDGQAVVNLDEAARMSAGTFAALNCNVQCFTSNETGWAAVCGRVESGSLIIDASDPNCADTVSWMVIGERCDAHIKDTSWTDSDGRVIVEPVK
jgi:hypothetical protein